MIQYIQYCLLFVLFCFRFTSKNLYVDTWKHVCLTWENTQRETKLYRDGQFTGQLTNNTCRECQNYALKASGFLGLGQRQDSIGGGFDRTQTLYSRLASVSMWNKVLSESNIAAQYTNAAYLMVLFLKINQKIKNHKSYSWQCHS